MQAPLIHQQSPENNISSRFGLTSAHTIPNYRKTKWDGESREENQRFKASRGNMEAQLGESQLANQDPEIEPLKKQVQERDYTFLWSHKL